MCLSTSAKCSEAALVLMLTSVIFGIILLNFMSINIFWSTNAALEYNVIIHLRLHANGFAVGFVVNSAIIKSIPLPYVTTKAKLLTNITSAVSITYLFNCVKPVYYHSSVFFGLFFCLVLTNFHQRADEHEKYFLGLLDSWQSS